MSTRTQCSGLSSRARPRPVRQLLLSVAPRKDSHFRVWWQLEHRTRGACHRGSGWKWRSSRSRWHRRVGQWRRSERQPRGDGVWGITRSPSQAGVFGFNFGLGPGLRGYGRRPDRGAARTTDREWCRGRREERRRQRRTRRGECEPGHRRFRRAHRQWSSVGGHRARGLFFLWEWDNRRRSGFTDREQSSRHRRIPHHGHADRESRGISSDTLGGTTGGIVHRPSYAESLQLYELYLPDRRAF
jgi:hypothetical protein